MAVCYIHGATCISDIADRRAKACPAEQHAGSVWGFRLCFHVPPLHSQVFIVIITMVLINYHQCHHNISSSGPFPRSPHDVRPLFRYLLLALKTPSLVTPVRTKSKIPAILGLDFVVIAAFYLLVSLTGIFAFDRVPDLYTLAFQPAPGVWTGETRRCTAVLIIQSNVRKGQANGFLFTPVMMMIMMMMIQGQNRVLGSSWLTTSSIFSPSSPSPPTSPSLPSP